MNEDKINIQELVDSICSEMQIDSDSKDRLVIPVRGFRDNVWKGVLAYFGYTLEDAMKEWGVE